MNDTDPESLRVQGEVLRRLTGPERFAAACEMTLFAQRLTRAGIRARWPGATEAQVEAEHYRLAFGPALAREILDYRDRRKAPPSESA